MVGRDPVLPGLGPVQARSSDQFWAKITVERKKKRPRPSTYHRASVHQSTAFSHRLPGSQAPSSSTCSPTLSALLRSTRFPAYRCLHHRTHSPPSTLPPSLLCNRYHSLCSRATNPPPQPGLNIVDSVFCLYPHPSLSAVWIYVASHWRPPGLSECFGKSISRKPLLDPDPFARSPAQPIPTHPNPSHPIPSQYCVHLSAITKAPFRPHHCRRRRYYTASTVFFSIYPAFPFSCRICTWHFLHARDLARSHPASQPASHLLVWHPIAAD